MENLILVFLRAPRVGQVKTRLGRVVGAEEATRLYRRMVETVLRRLPADRPVRLVFSPEDGEGELREWLRGVSGVADRDFEFRAQAEGGLGERLQSAFSEAFSEGWGRVAAIGSDCVDVDEAHFESAWRMLDSGIDLVLGPAADGGYYLVALRRWEPGIFRGVPWSSERTLEVTVERARGLGWKTAFLETLRDIDTVEDLEVMADRLA